MFAGGGIGTTTTDKKKMLRRQLGSGLLIAALAGAVILVNHSFFLREQGFSKNLTGVLVTRIVGDDPLNSLQGALVEKLNAELQKKRRGSRLKCMRAARSSMRTTVSRQRTNAPGLSGSGSMQRLSSGDEKSARNNSTRASLLWLRRKAGALCANGPMTSKASLSCICQRNLWTNRSI